MNPFPSLTPVFRSDDATTGSLASRMSERKRSGNPAWQPAPPPALSNPRFVVRP